jgi:long-subunit acyl-CoA synthetase (AMP-forming)
MSAVRSPLEALVAHAAEAPERVILRDLDGQQLSRRELLNAVATMVGRLASHGLGEGHGERPVVGLLVSDGIPWTVSLLALESLGACPVLLPDFFSDQQLVAILEDSAAQVVIADPSGSARLAQAGVASLAPWSAELSGGAAVLPLPRGRGVQMVYSSGTSGQPKGVVQHTALLDAKAAALIDVVGASAQDHVLSILPMALLLEQMVAVRAALQVGASVTFAQQVLRQGVPQALVAAAQACQPTIAVLTPDLLKAWVAGLAQGQRRAPASLRFLAVGGAAVAPALAEVAWGLGLPVYEGYGLTETCSVATVNRPGQRVVGSVGWPLPGVRVVIEKGEVVIESEQLLAAYHHAPEVNGACGRWYTGDLGRLAEDGSLEIFGRRDARLVLSSGRTVSPEWVESVLLADPRIAYCCALAADAPTPVAVIEVQRGQDVTQIEALAHALVAGLPAYARPERLILVEAGTFAACGVLTGNGRLQRKRALTLWGTECAAPVFS